MVLQVRIKHQESRITRERTHDLDPLASRPRNRAPRPRVGQGVEVCVTWRASPECVSETACKLKQEQSIGHHTLSVRVGAVLGKTFEEGAVPVGLLPVRPKYELPI